MSFKWVPNALTIMRCFGAFVVGWVIYRYWFILASYSVGAEPQFQQFADFYTEMMQLTNWAALWPFILFVLVAASDFLDGYFARKLNAVSAFGAFLDPVADKLLVAVSLIAIAFVLNWDWIILLPAIVIIARDAYVTALRLRPTISLPVSKLAKYKTALEMAGIGGYLLAWAIMGGIGLTAHPDTAYTALMDATLPLNILSYASLALIYLAAALSAYTGWLYVRSAMAKA